MIQLDDLSTHQSLKQKLQPRQGYFFSFLFFIESGNALSEKCCLEGIVYLGSRTWSRFWNPEFWTTLNGRRSLTVNYRMAPEIAFALLELCGSLAENNVKRTCLLEWVVCLTVAAFASRRCRLWLLLQKFAVFPSQVVSQVCCYHCIVESF